jgi:hypothetical protein
MATNLQHIERLFHQGKQLKVVIGLDEAAPAVTARPMVPGDQPNGNGNGNGQVSPEFHRGTIAHLAACGVDPDDIGQIGGILAKYSGMNSDGEMLPGGGAPRGVFNQTGPMGNQDGARDRRHAYDASGRLLPPMRSFNSREDAEFEKRFPGILKIKRL